ncbi:3-phosphoshikimate 1-carboxyvinyltransferase [Lactobacillus mellis]|nr:3-phosphoshikimate 1-carboxyvinyltransferase [Bombilactobacillus mellis]
MIMQLILKPQQGLHGTIQVPGDKSISHRALIIGAMGLGTTTIHNFLFSQDCLTTLQALKNFGVDISQNNETVIIHGQGIQSWHAPAHALDMGNSGTTTRLLVGLLAGRPFTTTLIGDQSLSQRPMQRIQQPLQKMGAVIHLTHGHLPMTISGQPLHSLCYQMPLASAQVTSTLILAALQASDASTIMEKLPTRDHTERLLRQFGAHLTTSDDHYKINIQPAHQLQGQTIQIPADLSSAAFFLTAASIIPHSQLQLTNVGLNPTRTGFLKVSAAKLHPIVITATEIPNIIDDIPLIALLAATADGRSKITGAGELRVKETDRIHTTVEELSKLGIAITELADGFIIDGRQPWSVINPHLDSHGDHRIGMMLAIAALKCSAPLHLKNAAVVNISYPNFFQYLNNLLSQEETSS